MDRITRKEAKIAGLKRFYTGPCKYGHEAERYTATGQCVECARLKCPAKSKRYYARHKAQMNAASRAFQLMKNFGLTPEAYDVMLLAQSGVCACCGRGQGAKRLHVDHDHATGRVRKLLCARCNTAIGQLEHPLRPVWEAYLASFPGDTDIEC